MRTNLLRKIVAVHKPAAPVLVLLLLALLVFVETRVNFAAEVYKFDEETCSPMVLDPRKIEYHSGHRFYAELKETSPPPPPQLREQHAKLCSKKGRLQAKFEYCLPISGRKDSPFCTAPDRMNLLNVDAKSICYASVLHMLMVDVYEELQATDNTPFLAFGSLLGAVRNGSMIPFTEDADIGYVKELVKVEKVRLALRRKGYHMFFMGIWRVCVAPTHPLSGRLYDPMLPKTESFAVPYVDLYRMKENSNGDWDLEELEGSNGQILPADKVQPFSQVTINGMAFDTVKDPKFFLTEAYGDDYMAPKPRNESQELEAVTKHPQSAMLRLRTQIGI